MNCLLDAEKWIFHLFLSHSLISVSKDVRLNSTHYLIMKINNRKQLQNTAINNSADIDYSHSRFESSCSHLNFRFRACFEQGVPWHSGNYRMWTHSETRTWHDKKIQSDFVRIYRECTRKPYSFLKIDTTFPASNSLRFRKKLLPSYKNDSNWSA